MKKLRTVSFAIVALLIVSVVARAEAPPIVAGSNSDDFFKDSEIQFDGFASYVFGGYGLKFDSVKWGIGHVGAGLEFRFLPQLAWFFDGRFIFGHDEADTGLFRTGMRVIF